ncbi:hypothetical protein QT636_22635, partial [Xanthomonas citri pv. citri]
LWKTYSSGHVVLWAMGVVAAFLTATYMFRLLYMTFFGERRPGASASVHPPSPGGADAHAAHGHDAHAPAHHDAGGHGAGHGHLHDAPAPMAIALIVLAIGSIGAGFVGVPHALKGHNAIEAYLAPSFAPPGGVAGEAVGET